MSGETTSPKWLGYHRISHIGGRTDTPTSEGEYREKVTRFAAAKGWDVELLPVERDQTGSRLKRPILDAAIGRIESGEAAGLVVVRYNRLSRATVSDTHMIVERIEGAGGRVEAVEEQFPDTPEGRMARSMSFATSRMEWERSAAYLRDSKRRAVEAGIWPFTSPPPGYTVVRKKQGGDGKLRRDTPTEVRRIRQAFRAKARGDSVTSVAERLGVGLSHAGKILSNPAYLGQVRLRFKDGEELVNTAAHEPLIDRALFEAAQIKQPRRARNGGPSALLAGLVRCGSCGGAMTPGVDGKGVPYYRCPGLPRANGKRCKREAMVSRRKLDTYVESVALPHIETVRATASVHSGDLERLGGAAERAEAARDDFAIATAGMAREHIAAGMAAHVEKVRQARAELATAHASVPEVPNVPDLGALYRSWPVEKRAHLLRGALSGVTVARGRGPAVDRVGIFAAGFDVGDPEGEVGPVAAE